MTASALLIGGPPASGKSTVANRLARRHGFRLYGSDTRTWAHRDRAMKLGNAAARRWEALSRAERWDDTRPTVELLAMSLHHARGAMIVDDLMGLADGPLVVAEGTAITPSALAASPLADAPAVWLLPTAAFQDEQLAGRDASGGVRRLYRALREVIEQEAKDHGVPVIGVDQSTPVAFVQGQVEAMFRDELASATRAATTAQRRLALRDANLDVVEQVRAFYRRPWATGDPDVVVATFLCECGSVSCETEVRTTVGTAAAASVTAAAAVTAVEPDHA